jgi:hypothetical protein
MISTLLILVVVGAFAITGVFILRDSKDGKDSNSKNRNNQ